MTIIDIDRPAVTPDHTTAVAAAAPEPPAALPQPIPQANPRTSAVPETAPRRRLFADLGGPLSGAWAGALAVAWVVVVAVGLAVEPAPADPDAAVPLVATVLSTGLLSIWGAMAAGMFQRRRFAAAASLAGGVGLLALTVGCPVSGHHGGIGAWWGLQIVGAVALIALSRRALRSA